ncbi:TlyA family RNA methyltransferase [Metamycoplasma phocicerebrale]|uniref:TlyA family RNA methyltransferase n=1 Tax=Metamycoplasma phocicerebrale TaxID=142649 RepID=A0A3Q9V8G9_9BACT|nr:TlyA family RNA methyltransferase [Metamycoplasma phocicerebrale]AZZ65469.1 TlyA family RNA methyltransferase [Metamycoplasma phocicerebrale]
MKKTLKELLKLNFNFEDDKEIDSIVMQGKVIVNNEKILLSSLKFPENVKIRIINHKIPYVSRGAFKLKEALKQFKVDVNNKICLDIGSSTGGFVQVLLEAGASKVFALDSGTNQLDYSLRINEKVIVYEKTNIKNILSSMFNEKIDLITCDVSFISLKYVFEACSKTFEKIDNLIVLIKPQFEASSKYVEQGGFVKEEHHNFIINRVLEYANNYGFKLLNPIVKSPILGDKSKNIEYLANFQKGDTNEY